MMDRIQEKLKLLVVDDDDLVLQSIQLSLPDHWDMIGVHSLEEIPDTHLDAAFVDMHLSGNITVPEGLDVIRHLHNKFTHLDIVSISGDLDRDLMEDCLRCGATRFLAKPLSPEEIRLLLEKIESLLLLQGATHRASQIRTPWIGSSSFSNEIKRQIAEMAGEPGPILIEGESGTGKEVVARLLHSYKSERPFIAVNVAALPENLFESEVFGHVKGAFTGADQNKMGLAEAANGGDLFLDEIEALPSNLQAKLLRFLESGELRRVGSKENISVNVRVIAATNRNLEEMVKKNEFREDLMWRLSGKRILLKPLRERPDDVQDLASYFLKKERPRRNKSLSHEALHALKNYNWPGNVRELKRVFEQLCLIAPLPIIRSQDVEAVLNRPSTMIPMDENIDLKQSLADLMANYERKVLTEAVKSEKDVDALSKNLGISRSSLYKKLKDHRIELR